MNSADNYRSRWTADGPNTGYKTPFFDSEAACQVAGWKHLARGTNTPLR